MKLQSIIKNILFYSLLAMAFFCPSQSVTADLLQFHVGDTASYTVTQKADYNIECFGITNNFQRDFTIEFDIQLLSLNETTSSYPFTVEVRCKTIGPATLPLGEYPDPYEGGALLNFLTNNPLQFEIDSEFNVQETTGNLLAVYETYEDLMIPAELPSFFEFFLTQIFQLSGQDLVESNSYPANCYQLLNWQDEPIYEDEASIVQTSNYTIDSINSDTIQATWQGNAEVKEQDISMDGTVSVNSGVTWDSTQSLIQQRNLSAQVSETFDQYFSGRITMNLELIISGSNP